MASAKKKLTRVRRRPVRRKQGTPADESEQSVVCLLCGRSFRVVNHFHLWAAHGFEREHPINDYKEQFNLPVAKCGNMRANQSEEMRRFWAEASPEILDDLRENMSQGQLARWRAMSDEERELRSKRMAAQSARYWEKLGLHWTSQSVLTEIRRRYRTGESLCHTSTCPRLLAAGCRYFGNWPAAVRMAGIDYGAITGRRHWNRPSIIAEIQRLASTGMRLNTARMDREYGGLYQAACKEFAGGWSEALAAAGLNPAMHRVPKTEWTHEKASAWVVERAATPAALVAKVVPEPLRNFVKRELTMTWTAFVESFGISYPGQKKCLNWTKRRVVLEIKRRHARGAPMNSPAVSRSDRALIDWARKLFGSWDEACVAGGLDPSGYRHRLPPWNEDRAVRWMRAQIASGRPVTASAASDGLWRFVKARLKLHWVDFAKSFGVDDSQVGRKRDYWTRRMVLDEIRRRHREGRPMNARSVSLEYSALINQANKLFGSWDTACKAAGLRPDDYRRQREWTDGRVLREIRGRQRQGHKMNAKSIGREYGALMRQAIKRFRSWDAACEAAGIGIQRLAGTPR